jgi:DNA modification methylase
MEVRIDTVYNEDCMIKLLDIHDESIDLIITDPPYGILPNGKNMRNKKKDNYKWDNIELEQFTKEWFELCYKKLKNDRFMFIMWSQKYLKLGFEIFNPDRLIFWRHNNLTNGGNGYFSYDYDPIFVIKKGNPKLIKGKHSCDLEYTKPQSNFKIDKLIHPTQKPLLLGEHIIRIATKENDIVLDPFAGGGTFLLAAKILNRRYIGFEKEEDYCKIIDERIKNEKI